MKAIALAFLLALPAAAADLELQVVPMEFPCLNSQCTHIAVPAIVMDAIAESNAKLGQEVKELQAKQKEPPKCAALEVVPKKPLPPLKKDRDS